MALQITDTFRVAKVATRTFIYLSILLVIIAGIWMNRQSNASAMSGNLDGTSFITTWKTDNPGSSNSTSIAIPVNVTGGSSYNIDWDNDGVFDEFNLTGNATHDYGVPGVYTVRIQGEALRIAMRESQGDSQKLLEINQWGTTNWITMKEAFRGAKNVVITASDTPDLSGVTNMEMMFGYASALTDGLSEWDVSNVTNTSYMFSSATSFNEDLSSWDVSNVTDMSIMFGQATSFNGDLSSWDVSSATSMLGMFQMATAFDGDLSSWDVSNVTSFDGMFSGASSFKGNVSSWNVHNARYMDGMFRLSGLSTENYDAILVSWAAQPIQNGVTLSASPTCYSAAGSARSFLIEEKGWQINDGGDCSDIREREITSVHFTNSDGRKYMVIEGHKMLAEVSADVFYTQYVTLNGVALPVCIDALGRTVEQMESDLASYSQMFSVNPNLSLSSPCFSYMSFDENGNPMVDITPEKVRIWLPDTFDSTKPGVVTVSELNQEKLMNEMKIETMNPLSYEFNSSSSPNNPDSPSFVVDGSAIDEVVTISKRPAFSGKAEPGATVTVTVYSDPVSCTTIADQNGDWSCTLPSDLPAGVHTAYVRIVNTDNSVQEFGPYVVTVDGVVAGVINNNTPGAPNTGFVAENVAALNQLNSASQTIVISSFAIAGAIAALVAGAVVFGSGMVARNLRKSLKS